jgi:hypothetical protein
MARRISTLALALLLVLVACTNDRESTTTSRGDIPTTTTTVTGPTTTGSDATTTTSPQAPPTTEPDLSGVEGLSDEVKTQLEDLIRAAQEIRDLPFLTPPNIKVVTVEELEAMVREDIEEESEDLPADEALYKMLGLLAEGADFEQIILDLYGEQVAGFYDGDTGEIVVPARETGLSVLQRGTIVHELVHALTDQHFSFFPRFREMIEEERLDEATAYQALMEGDATLAEVLWVQTLSQREIGEFIAESLGIDTSALDSAPRFLTESLIFPYDTGLSFVQDLYSRTDWSQVNDAYSTLAELPGSSEQVISPDDYTRDLPRAVDIPSVSVTGYELQRTSVWGEQGFRIMLNQGSGVETLATAADGWGGDSYHQWFDGENAAMLIVYEGDTPGDVEELERALLDFALESFPEERFAWVEVLDGRLFFIAADQVPIGEQIRAAVGLD